MSNFSYGVIGLGKVGYAFSRNLATMGKLRWVVTSKSRSEIGYSECVVVYKTIEEISIPVDVIAIAVSDASIQSVAEKLKSILPEKKICQVAFHFSGALNINLLDELRNIGVKTLALHPMQTFGVYREDIFDSIFWGVECLESDRSIAEEIISDVGGKPYFLDEAIVKNKASYHVIGVTAANFLQGIIEFSRLLCEKQNLPADTLLIPILQTAFDNSLKAIKESKNVPITGPVARGDVEVLHKHVDSLSNKGFGDIEYKLLVQFLSKLLFEQGKISHNELNKILEIILL